MVDPFHAVLQEEGGVQLAGKVVEVLGAFRWIIEAGAILWSPVETIGCVEDVMDSLAAFSIPCVRSFNDAGTVSRDPWECAAECLVAVTDPAPVSE